MGGKRAAVSLSNARRPLLGFAAWSGTGKTTLLVRLLPVLRAEGLRIGMIKHAHHTFEIDHPGKDSFELRKAGAAQMLVASRSRWALVVEEAPGARDEPRLDDLLGHLDQERLDLILVEGFKHETFPKIELYRRALGKSLLFPRDPSIIAIASDCEIPEARGLPRLDINQPVAIAHFIRRVIIGKWRRQEDAAAHRAPD